MAFRMRTSEADLCVVYDGEALKEHLIDVRDLAPALLGLGQLFEEANRVVNGDRATVSVRVKAQKEGSFAIYLDIFQTLGKQLESILIGTHVTAAVNLAGLLGLTAGTGAGLLTFLKWLRKRKARLLPGSKPGTVVVEIDGDRFEVSEEVIKLSEDIGVRTALKRVLEPLHRDGIDKFEVRDVTTEGSIPIETITTAEAEFFEIPQVATDIADALPERAWTQAFSLVTVTFKEDNKWRLSDGTSTIGATMCDDSFLARMENRTESFVKGDVLVCEMKAVQSHRSDGLHTEYQITHVVEHRQFVSVRRTPSLTAAPAGATWSGDVGRASRGSPA
jgi:hypothetical protein